MKAPREQRPHPRTPRGPYAAAAAEDRILVDTDPGLGRFGADVDDALAVWFLHRVGAPIAGLCSVFGNAPLAHTDRAARGLGAAIGVPVHRGAAAPGDRATEAADALAAHRGPVLALGPLTNVAAALARGARWPRLVVLGGTARRLPNLRPLHTTELNLALDLGAAEVVLAHGCELVPMEACRSVRFGRDEVAALPRWLRARCRSWIATSPLRTGRFAFHPWDLVAAAWLDGPEGFTATPGGARLDRRRGRGGHVFFEEGPGTVIRRVDACVLRRRWDRAVA